MKKIRSLLIVSFATLLFMNCAIPQSLPESNNFDRELAIENLLIGVKSCNKGLSADCTYLLGELCCNEAVVPLMRILRNAVCEEVRILAALSLYKIGDSRGLHAIRQAVKFDESARVKRMCAIFYNTFYLSSQKS